MVKKVKTNVNFSGGGDRFQHDKRETKPGPGYYNSALSKDYIRAKGYIKNKKVRKSTSLHTFEPTKKELSEFDFRLMPV